MKKISITGADATGKTSLLQNLIELKMPNVKIFFSPHFHKSEESPLGFLSQIFEKINLIANQNDQPSLKVMALILGMTLYREYEKFYTEKFMPDYLISERHCLVDALAFFPVYRQIISGIDSHPLPWKRWLKTEENQALQNWLTQITAKIKTHPEQDSWQALTKWVLSLVDLDLQALLKALMDFYNCTLPDEVYILTAEFSTLQKRLERRQETGKKLEWHEKGTGLLTLQDSFLKIGDWLMQHNQCKVSVIKTDIISSLDLAKTIRQIVIFQIKPHPLHF